MSASQQATGQISGAKPSRLTNIYARFGFANRNVLMQKLHGLNSEIQNHSLLLDLLVSKGILKSRFREDINSLDQVQEHMLCGSVTLNQIKPLENHINCLATNEKVGSIMDTLEEGIAAAARAEALNQAMEGKVFDADSLFENISINVAKYLDRIFPTADGVHSKLAQGVGSFLNWRAMGGVDGKYRLGFVALVSLGLAATIASPLLFPVVGSYLCTIGAVLKPWIIGGGILSSAIGWSARIAGRYVHREGEDNSDTWYAWWGRQEWAKTWFTRIGMVGLYAGLTFGTSVSNTFVLGNWLLEHGAWLGGLTAGIPGLAVLTSVLYNIFGVRSAVKANEGVPPPYGDEATRLADIKKTHRYSGTAVCFASMYFLYRWIATSIFVTAAFTPITSFAVGITALGVGLGFAGGHFLPHISKKIRSPWFSYISGTLGSVALPMLVGALTGEYSSIGNTISSVLSLGVFAQDIHSTSHGVFFHQGQIRSLYPDRLVPNLSMSEKKAYAGHFGRKGATHEFSAREFNPQDGFTIEGLCQAINSGNYGITLNSPDNSIERLNEILCLPKFFERFLSSINIEQNDLPGIIKIFATLTEDSRAKNYEDLSDREKKEIRQLNRLILEYYYSNLCPKSELPRTSFWEKAHVKPPDVVFSAVTSAIFEANAYLKQCLLQCDAPNRGVGKAAKDVLEIVRITEQSQNIINELYAMCRAKLDAYRKNPDDLEQGYDELIALLCQLGCYFSEDVPKKIKEMRDDFNQEWKGIYDASIDISLKKAGEFFAWAHELEIRKQNNDQLTTEEVRNTLLYLCDRFDKEFILGVRKDSNEYVMRIQKNENQSGLREFIGNTGYEITRFNARTGQASIERILATHIRRQNMEWEHDDPAEKYHWYHRTSEYLENDPQSVKEYREAVKSHSKDLAFVINDEHGAPLALQTNDGQILLIKEDLSSPLLLKLADGTEVTVSRTAGGFAGLSSRGIYQIDTVRNYNQLHDNKIYLVAKPDQNDPRKAGQPEKIEDFPEGVNDYYKNTEKRPLYVYAIDPHDYEFNLDSEFVNGRIAFEYVPIFEKDRENQYAAISYADPRPVELDYALSGLPRDEDGNPILPSNIQLNWSPMHLVIKTKDGKEYIVPYLEEKNSQVEPTLTVDKKPITDWKILLEKYAPYFLKGSFKNGEFEAIFKPEFMLGNGIEALPLSDRWVNGINEIILTLPEAPFVVESDGKQEKIVPTSPEELIAFVKAYLASESNSKEPIEIGHKRKLNWRKIKRVDIDHEAGKLYFIYDVDNGNEARQEVPAHHSNPEVYSMHLPSISEIDSVEVETFRKSVGTLPYARYFFRFDTPEEAEQRGYAEVKRDEEGNIILDQNHQPVMESGCPIWIVYSEDGEILGYELERFGRAESIFQLGAFDPSSVNPASVKYDPEKKKLTFDAVEWGRIMFPIERDLMDLGTEDHPKAKIKGVIADAREIFGSGSVIWSKIKDAAGKEVYQVIKLGKKLKDVLSIINVEFEKEENGKITIQITRKEKHGELTFTDMGTVDESDFAVFGIRQKQVRKALIKAGYLDKTGKIKPKYDPNKPIVLDPAKISLSDKEKEQLANIFQEGHQKSFIRQMWYSAEWVEKVEFGNMTSEGREIKIYYKNPHTDQPLEGERRMQTIFSKDERLAKVDNYHAPTMEQREIYDKEGNRHLIPYLKFTRVKMTSLTIDSSQLPKEQIEALEQGKLSILNPKSALRIEMEDGQEEILPLNDKIDGEDFIFDENANERYNGRFSEHLPHLEDGKTGLIIGPQLSISGRNWYGYATSGIPYCALDQSIFMAYDLSYGYNYGRQPYVHGIGGGHIQNHKSRAGDGRIRETATVQNGTPVGRPLRKTLASGESWNEVEFRQPFFSFAPMPATITEDYREGKGIYKKHGHSTVFYNKVVAIGAGVEDLSQILTQRRRWPTSVPIGQYWFFRDLWDELIKAKLLGKYPSYYTWDQLLHEWNGVTWYYCGMAEYLRSFAPLAYFMGFTAYPVDPIAFPLVWFGSFTSSMKSHTYSMAKVGNHWLESVFYGQATYKTLVPNFVEMLVPQPGSPKTQGQRRLEELATPRLAKECLGQFGVTALSGGGKMDERYQMQITDDVWLKAATFARGLLEMQNYSNGAVLDGSFSPDLFSLATTYFAILMNTIWPYYDMILNREALRLAKNDRREDPNLVDAVRYRLIAQMIRGETNKGYRPILKNKMQYTLGITDWPTEPKEQARYIQDLSARELCEVFRNMPDKAAAMLEEMLNAEHLVPHKVATILEAMLFDDKEINTRVLRIFRSKLPKTNGKKPPQLLEETKREVKVDALFSAGQAVNIILTLSEKNRREVLESMTEEKRKILIAILP